MKEVITMNENLFHNCFYFEIVIGNSIWNEIKWYEVGMMFSAAAYLFVGKPKQVWGSFPQKKTIYKNIIYL